MDRSLLTWIEIAGPDNPDAAAVRVQLARLRIEDGRPEQAYAPLGLAIPALRSAGLPDQVAEAEALLESLER